MADSVGPGRAIDAPRLPADLDEVRDAELDDGDTYEDAHLIGATLAADGPRAVSLTRYRLTAAALRNSAISPEQLEAFALPVLGALGIVLGEEPEPEPQPDEHRD